jgi:phycocyanin-associated rod linker protein
MFSSAILPSSLDDPSSVATGSGDRLYRIEVAAMSLPRYPKVRRSNREYIVSYEQLNSTLQRINKMGGKVASVTTV